MASEPTTCRVMQAPVADAPRSGWSSPASSSPTRAPGTDPSTSDASSNHPGVAAAAAAAAAAPARRKCVLIIEDHHTHACALRSILIRKGLNVVVAETVRDGIALLEWRPDYILLDLMLPDGDGLQVLQRVRAEQPEATVMDATRVIVTTGVSDPHRLREVRALQPYRLLKKPIDLVDLLGAIGMM